MCSNNHSEKVEGHSHERAEVVAACRAVEDAIAQGLKSVEVHTNSQFVIDAMTTLVEKWKTNGWKTRRKVPVANREDLERLELLSQRVAVKWVYDRFGCNSSDSKQQKRQRQSAPPAATINAAVASHHKTATSGHSAA